MAESIPCGTYQWGEPTDPDDGGGGRCTLQRGHSGSHVDHDNHYGPVIWDGRGNSTTFDREKQRAFYERGQREQAKMAAAFAAQARRDAMENSMTVTEFLLSRIAEDEDDNKDQATLDDDDRGGWAVLYAQRVLAECAVKRAIISAFNPESPDLDPYVGRDVIAMLAAVYKDHADYLQEWANG